MTFDVPTALGILLVALAAGFVLLPIARGTRPDAVASDPGPIDRFGLYRQVLELEFDRELGKLSSADYDELSAELLAEAGKSLREEKGHIAELDDEIEREIAAARAAFAAARLDIHPGRGTRVRRASAVLAALVLVALTALPVAAAPNDGTLTGRIVNRSAGGSSTGGTGVVLVSFGRKEQAPIGQVSTQADGDGRYSFTGLDRDPNIVYLAVARFQNVNYPVAQPFQLQDESTHQADIDVFEATTADDAIQFERLNLLVVSADQGVVQFMEMGSLVNNGDRTFVTANPQDQQLAHAIKFALPSGALGVQMQTGFSDQDVTAGVGGIQVTSPVPPGSHQFALSFQLPYSGSSADVSMQMPYPTGTYSVYLPDNGIKLDASALKSGGPAQLGGQSYALYTANNLARSTMVEGQLSGLGSNGAIGPNQLALISLGVVLFVLGGGVILFGGRRRMQLVPTSPGLQPVSEPVVDFDHERLELVVRLAALDERFAAGEVSETTYAAERDLGKQRLRELTRARQQATATRV